ncbi:12785_t:CDS:2 [Gigaspora rosea]|nr:12785_t:CDS:2 [Gigaspora rosea]
MSRSSRDAYISSNIIKCTSQNVQAHNTCFPIIILSYLETEHKNKIKDARAQGIAPPPKCKNINPPTSRFKNTTVQSSETISDIAEVDNKIDDSLIASNGNDSPSHYIRSSATSSNSIKVRRFELNNDDYIPEPFTATPHTVRSSRALKVPTQKLLATSSKAIEVVDSSNYNDASELSTITSHTIKLSTPSRIQTQLSTSTNMIETGNSNVNDNNDTSKFFTISPLARRSLRSSNLVRLSTSSKAIGKQSNDNSFLKTNIVSLTLEIKQVKKASTSLDFEITSSSFTCIKFASSIFNYRHSESADFRPDLDQTQT